MCFTQIYSVTSDLLSTYTSILVVYRKIVSIPCQKSNILLDITICFFFYIAVVVIIIVLFFVCYLL